MHGQARCTLERLISTIVCEVLGAPMRLLKFGVRTARGREGGGAFVVTEPETEGCCPRARQDKCTLAHEVMEEGRKRCRKCQRGCVMLSLIVAHVAPASCTLMCWENTEIGNHAT